MPDVTLPDPGDGATASDSRPVAAHHVDGLLEHPQVRYERSDVQPRGVLIVMLAALFIGVLAFLGVWYFYQRFNAYESAIKQSPYPLATQPSTQLPAEPRLEQVDRLAGVETPNVFLREQSKEAILHSAGPTADKGFAHIPIERAMQMVADELPVRPQKKERGPVKDNGLLDSGAPNSGRLFREGPR
jgi:hypothetical protein